MDSFVIVGLGSLGNEILKKILTIKVKKLLLIDPDIIEISNLNKQFYFKEEDLKKYKVKILQKKIKEFFPEIKIEVSKKKIQEINFEILRNYFFIILTVDNIETRNYVNFEFFQQKKIIDEIEKTNLLKNNKITQKKNFVKNQFLFDFGSNLFLGHIRIISDYFDSCLNCNNELFDKNQNIKNICSIKGIPGNFEDCVNITFLKIEKIKKNEKFKENLVNEKLNNNSKNENILLEKEIIEIEEQLKKKNFLEKNEDYLGLYKNAKRDRDLYINYLKCVKLALKNNIALKNFEFFCNLKKQFVFNISSTNLILAGIFKKILILIKKNKKLKYNYFFVNSENQFYLHKEIFQKNKNCFVCQKSNFYFLQIFTDLFFFEIFDQIFEIVKDSKISIFFEDEIIYNYFFKKDLVNEKIYQYKFEDLKVITKSGKIFFFKLIYK